MILKVSIYFTMLVSFMVVLFPTQVFAQDDASTRAENVAVEIVADFTLHQAWESSPQITAYLELLSEDGAVVSTPSLDTFSGTLGNIPLEFQSIKPFAQTGEGIGYILLVDISKSLSQAEFSVIKQSLQSWVERMKDADRATVMTFGEKVLTQQEWTGDGDLLKASIEKLKLTDNKTALHSGLVKAMQLRSARTEDVPRRMVILVLSDGLDEEPGGMTESEVLRKMEVDRTPVYALGLYRGTRNKALRENGLKLLGQFARESGGKYVDARNQDLEKAYSQMNQRIRNAFTLKAACPGCAARGQVERLQLAHQSSEDSPSIESGLDMRLVAPKVVAAPEPEPEVAEVVEPPPSNNKTIIIVVIICVVLAMVVLALLLRRKKKAAELAQAAEIEDSLDPAEDISENDDVGEEPAVQEDGNAGKDIQTKEVQSVTARAAPVLPKIVSPFSLKLVSVGSTGPVLVIEEPIEGTVYLGRENGPRQFEITDDGEVSSTHCSLELRNGAVFLNDNNSTNGTFLNGVPVTSETLLSDDDVIEVGRTRLRFQLLWSES